ncbi:type II secretion system protein GspE, partial [Candidatus Roizmanbacteria bacterium]|nr:type II secretion system protein GspE [Candidatus Roizmanbacteria bacterium]
IFEVLRVTPAINKMILQQASGREIENQAKKESLITMKQDGYLKALEGITTIEEVLRVGEV